MKKVYEAFGKEKEDIINIRNELNAFDKEKANNISVKDLVMITRVNNIPNNNEISSIWTINAIKESQNSENEILIFEPLINHLENELEKNGLIDINFYSKIKLSSKAIFLFPVSKYIKIANNLEGRRKLRNKQIRLYEGTEKLALKMLMQDNGYIFLNLDKNRYEIDEKNHPDIVPFTKKITQIIDETNKKIMKNSFKNENQIKLQNNFENKTKSIIKSNLENNEQAQIQNNKTTIKTHNEFENKAQFKDRIIENKDEIKNQSNFKIITGLTEKKEGEISLENSLFASTDIGKKRENQEDAVLLIKDKKNPNFKMMVVADGMGGEQKGEIASDIIVTNLKNWFESLTESQKCKYFYSTEKAKENLSKEIMSKIQNNVEKGTNYQGGSTLVCALIGKYNTMILNIGDSRAYIAKNNKLFQVSREDTVANIHLEKGIIPTKEASRFDEESNILLQGIGMNPKNLIPLYSKVVKNEDYDLLLLFTDGITDCLSDDNIVAICRNTDRKKLAKKIVEKAIRHDSIIPEKYEEYPGLTTYIPGGKDNATVAIFSNKKEKDDIEK